MTFSWPFLDKQGVITLRVFPDVAHLPTPVRPAELCAVSDGTTTTLYQSLLAGGVLGWYIVATPAGSDVGIRTNPSDARETQYTLDGGATWNSLSFLPSDAVTTAPVSGGENVIIGGSTFSALTAKNLNNQNAVTIESTGGSALALIATDGTGLSPALYLIRPDGQSYPNLVEAAVGGVHYAIINQFGAIMAEALATLPTASAAWEQAIAYRTAAVGVDAAAFICLKKGDGTFVWVQFAPDVDPPLDPTTNLLPPPALPPVGGSPVEFMMIVEASGTILPWVVPNHYKLDVPTIYGRWGETDSGSGAYSLDPILGGDPAVGGTNWGKLFYQERLNQGDTGTIGNGYPHDTQLNISGGQVQILQQQPGTISIGSAQGPFGSIYAVVKITPATIYDVNLTYQNGGSGPVGCQFGQIITVSGADVGSGFHAFEMITDVPVKLTVVSLAGYIDGSSSLDTMYAWDTADQTGNPDPHSWAHVFFAPQATGAAGLSFENLRSFGHWSQTSSSFSAQLKIEAP